MTGLTQELIDRLRAPFPLEAHELRDGGRDGKLVYLTEEPLADRLSEVDPNWQFRIVSQTQTDYGLQRPDIVTCHAELTVCGITRANVGVAVANVKRGEYDKAQGKFIPYETPTILPLSETEVKGAATDALKRCARMFGCGVYLLRTKEYTFKTDAEFARWYAREFITPTVNSQTGEVTRSERTPTTRAENSVQETDAPHSDELPPAAQERMDIGPRIEDLTSLATSLRTRTPAEMPEGVKWDQQVYMAAKGALGYKDDKAVKAALGVKSLHDWTESIDAMLGKLIDNAPALAEAA